MQIPASILFHSILGNSTYYNQIQQILNSNFLKNSMSDFNHYLNQFIFHNVHLASAEVILLAVGIIIFLGVAGEAFFRRTGIPDVAFFMTVLRIKWIPRQSILYPYSQSVVIIYTANKNQFFEKWSKSLGT